MDESTKNKIVYIETVFFVTVLIIYAVSDINPGFFQRNFIAASYADFEDRHLYINMATNTPGLKPWLISLKQVLGIPLSQIGSLPLGALGRGLLYIALVYRISDELIFAIPVGTVMAMYPWTGWGYSSIFVHALGSVLFLSTILILLIGVKQGFTRGLSVSLIIILIGIHVFDYTAEVWAILFLAALSMILYHNRVISKRLFIFSLISAIMYEDKNIVSTYFAFVTQSNPLTALTSYFFTTQKKSSVYAYSYTSTNQGLDFSTIYYISLLTIVTLYSLLKLYQLVREKHLPIIPEEKVILALSIAGGLTTVLYTFLGRFTQFFIFLCLPFIAIVSLYAIKDHTSISGRKLDFLAASLIFVLLMTAGGEFVSQLYVGDFDRPTDTNTKPAAVWLTNHVEPDSTVLTDLITEGRIRMPEEYSDANYNYIRYNLTIYRKLVNKQSVSADYIIIDYNSKEGVRTIGGWTRFDSLHQYREQIKRNPYLIQQYCNNDVCIYKNS